MPINRKIVILYILVAGIFLSATSPARSEDHLWSADRDKLKHIEEADCQKTWDILWPWAKKGNLEARMILLALVQWGGVTMPGHSDTASRIKDMTVLTIHSSGYTGDIKNIGAEDPRLTTFASADFQIIYKDFLECNQKENSKTCADKAVKGNLVQSFMEYSKEIDDLSALGYRVSCLDYENRKKFEEKWEIK